MSKMFLDFCMASDGGQCPCKREQQCSLPFFTYASFTFLRLDLRVMQTPSLISNFQTAFHTAISMFFTGNGCCGIL